MAKKREARDEFIGIRLEPSLKKEIEQAARDTHRSTSLFLIHCYEKWKEAK